MVDGGVKVTRIVDSVTVLPEINIGPGAENNILVILVFLIGGKWAHRVINIKYN